MPSIPIDFERIVQDVYEAILRPGDVAIDVGAHVGRHTLPMARCVGERGKVIAVEPIEVCRAELEQRLATEGLSSIVELAPVALSDHTGMASFVIAEEHLPHSGLQITPYPSPTTTSTIAVEVQTLDELCRDLDALHYIKLDAEGAELHILQGAMRCIERFRPVVGFEFGTQTNRAFGVEPADMAHFWALAGYRVYAITGQELDAVAFVQSAEERAIWDYVAVPEEMESLDRTVVGVLNRRRVNWLAIRAQLDHASDHAEVGAAVPPLARFRGPLRPFARVAAWLFLSAARMFTIPQSLCNRATLLAMQQLTDDLEAMERQSHEMQRRLDALEAELRQIRPEKNA